MEMAWDSNTELIKSEQGCSSHYLCINLDTIGLIELSKDKNCTSFLNTLLYSSWLSNVTLEGMK